MNSTGGTKKASDVNFSKLQAELDAISRENILQFKTPGFFTVIIRSLTILEGVALAVDKNFRLVRGSYPYVLNQLLSPESEEQLPVELENLLIRLLTVNGEQREIEWQRLRDFLVLAQKASKTYDPRVDDVDDKVKISRKTIGLLGKFLTSRSGLFLKKPLVHELAEAVDGMASMGEADLLRRTRGLVPILPGMNGPVNSKRIDEIRVVVDTFRDALIVNNGNDKDDESPDNQARMEAIMELFRELSGFLGDERFRRDAGPVLEELQSVAQMVAVEVLEIRGSRAVRSILGVPEPNK